MPFLTLQFFAPLFAGLYSLILGVFIFFLDRGSATHRYFLALCAAVATWATFVAIFHLPLVEHNLWNLLHWITGFFIAPAYLLLLIHFPRREIIVKPFYRIVSWVGAGLLGALVALFPELFFPAYIVDVNAIPRLTVGPYAWVIEVYLALYFGTAFVFAVKTLFRSYGRTRAHILTGLLGLAIATTGAVTTNVILAIHFGIELIWLGPIFALIGPASLAYMLLGIREEKPQLFPVAILGGAVLPALAYQTFTSQHIDAFIFNGAIFAGTIVLTLFLVRTILLESADVRGLQNLTKKLRRINEELVRADRVKSEFLAIASHHLRTPLTHIKWALHGFVQGEYDALPSDQQKKFFQNVLLNNERLIGFVRSLLDVSRIEAGKMRIQKKSVDLEALIKEIVADFEDYGESYRRIKITLHSSEIPVPKLLIDPELMRKVFENIIENAIVYNHAGGKVEISLETQDRFLQVAIRDTGIGMSSADFARAGEKFFRAEAAKRHAAEGAGIGLFVAKHIVNLHSGEIKIQSEENKGTAVFVRLPLVFK